MRGTHHYVILGRFLNADSNLALSTKPMIFLLSALTGVSLTACQGMDGDQAAAEIERGHSYAEANCSPCHAIGETGDSPYAPAPPFRTLSERYPLENLAEALAEGIGVTHGGNVDMPEFVLSPEEIDALLAYLATIQS
jgi:cytochrome c